MGIYGPRTRVKCLLDERPSLKATVLEGGKKSINWVKVGNFETLSQPNR